MKQGIKSNKGIGSRIRAFRNGLSMTQEKLAALMQLADCDISRGTLAKIEAGIRHISLEELIAIKCALQVDYKDLLE
ncbi:helix-turn-helix transcriptional regulator [Deferribacterales bacterium RsTz2092]|nr:transcriptional regulator [Deferribacterales bacterium]